MEAKLRLLVTITYIFDTRGPSYVIDGLVFNQGMDKCLDDIWESKVAVETVVR